MEKIFNGNDFANSRGFSDIRAMLRAAKYTGFDTPFVDIEPTGEPVGAFVSFGIWIAKCECNGAEYVAPGQPFYCASCGNYANGGKPRPVIFPNNAHEIETELLKRPVLNGLARNEFERAQRARAVVQTEKGFLSRTWLLGESIADLRNQNKELPKKRRR